ETRHVTGDVVDAYVREPVAQGSCCLFVCRQQHDAAGVEFRVDDVGGVGGERSSAGDGQRTWHRAFPLLSDAAGVDEHDVAVDLSCQRGRLEPDEWRACAQQGRAVAVDTFHAAEVAGRVGLPCQQFGCEAALVAGRNIVAPPGRQLFVPDG